MFREGRIHDSCCFECCLILPLSSYQTAGPDLQFQSRPARKAFCFRPRKRYLMTAICLELPDSCRLSRLTWASAPGHKRGWLYFPSLEELIFLCLVFFGWGFPHPSRANLLDWLHNLLQSSWPWHHFSIINYEPDPVVVNKGSVTNSLGWI